MSKDEQKLNNTRHSLAHLLAISILRKWPEAKLGIGPTIDDGFYYDILLPNEESITEKDLPKIEKNIKKIIKESWSFSGQKISKKEAVKIFKDQPFKLELIDELSEKEELTIYSTCPPQKEVNLSNVEGQMSNGCFVDLCRGGHVDNTKEINVEAFKLTKIAGAYWRGDENNQMLVRIYGVAFNTKEELEKYLKKLEEAKKRDHRKLGKELGLFSFSNLVGAGLPLWSPKGTVIRSKLQERLLKISEKYGMQPVTIPHIAKRDLYEASGHADKFGDELIKVISHYDEFVMKPVNCPHHTQIFASEPKSYRDLPVRYMESTMQYRDEKPGEIGGLTRVRSITVDDGHIFCRPDQIKDEAINIAKIIEEFYSSLGLYGKHWVSLSVRDPENIDGYIGEDKDWEKAESMLQEVSDDLKLNAKKIEGEAAIYGPKLDYVFTDSLGREWQLATIQIDFAMPKRFSLEYTNEKGEKETPVMIHRAILGSYERFIAILIEHFAGVFPVWLSPVQVEILPISEGQLEYAKKIEKTLKEKGMRVELPNINETLGKRIRNFEKNKTPYALIIGDQEKENKTVTLRSRGEKEQKEMKLEEFVGLLIRN